MPTVTVHRVDVLNVLLCVCVPEPVGERGPAAGGPGVPG